MRNKVKQLVTILLVFILQMTGASFKVFSAEKEIKVIVDGKQLQFDQPPVLVNGRVLVPMRSIFEALSYSVDWSGNDAMEGYRAVAYGDKIVGNSITRYSVRTLERTLWVEYQPEIDNTKTEIDFVLPLGEDNPVRVINGRTMLPTRIISEALGCKVDWDATTQTVTINSKDAKITYPANGWALKLKAHTEKYCPEWTVAYERYWKTEDISSKDEDVNQLKEAPITVSDSGEPRVYSVFDYTWNRTFEYTFKNPTIPTTPPVVGSVPAKILIDENRSKDLFIENPDNKFAPIRNVTDYYYGGFTYGGCNWYAGGRFWEVYGIPFPHFRESKNKGFLASNTYLDTADQYNEFIVIRDINDIRAYSMVVYGKGNDGLGHVAFIEAVEKNSEGKPLYVYLTEANFNNSTGDYRHGVDGTVKKYSFSEFIHRGKPVLGYIIPNQEFYKSRE